MTLFPFLIQLNLYKLIQFPMRARINEFLNRNSKFFEAILNVRPQAQRGLCSGG